MKHLEIPKHQGEAANSDGHVRKLGRRNDGGAGEEAHG
jgi:hypothetical protein